MSKKDRIDAFGAALLVGQSMLLGLNQVLIKLVNAGLGPVFQAGLRSMVATMIWRENGSLLCGKHWNSWNTRGNLENWRAVILWSGSMEQWNVSEFG